MAELALEEEFPIARAKYFALLKQLATNIHRSGTPQLRSNHIDQLQA